MTSKLLHRRMGIAALIVAGGVLLSRLLGLIREVIFAGMLGASAVTDEYVAAFTIPDFLNYLLAGGFLSITFIPIFARYLADDDEEGGWRAFAAILRPIAVGITVLILIGMALARPVVEALYPDFDAAQIEATTRYTRIVLPAQFFFVVGALFTAVQYAKGLFTIPTLAPIIYNLGIIAGGVLLNLGADTPSPEGFIWGALAGAFAGNFGVQWWGARRAGMRLPRDAGWSHPALKEYLTLAIPLMIGQSLVVLDEQLTRTFGSLVGDGPATQLQYARRTMLVPVGAIAQAAGVATYPFLARLFAEGRHRQMAATTARALRFVLVLSIGAGALLVALSVPAVRVLFERGEFTADDTSAAAAALAVYGFAVAFWGMQQVIARAFYARREMWTPVVIGTAATVMAIPLYWVLQRTWGIRGVATASTIALGGYTIALGFVWFRRTGIEHLRPLLASGLRALPLAATGALAAWLVAGIFDTLIGGWAGAFFGLLAAAVAFLATVFTGGSFLWDWRQSASQRHLKES